MIFEQIIFYPNLLASVNDGDLIAYFLSQHQNKQKQGHRVRFVGKVRDDLNSVFDPHENTDVDQ